MIRCATALRRGFQHSGFFGHHCSQQRLFRGDVISSTRLYLAPCMGAERGASSKRLVATADVACPRGTRLGWTSTHLQAVAQTGGAEVAPFLGRLSGCPSRGWCSVGPSQPLARATDDAGVSSG